MTKPIIIVDEPDKLHELVQSIIKQEGPHCDLNHIDVSAMTEMRGLFAGSDFQGDVSRWDVSNVDDFTAMFAQCPFNGDISKWDTGSALKMERMFQSASSFNSDISTWNVSKVDDFSEMFHRSAFQGNLSQWRTCNDAVFRTVFSLPDFKKTATPSVFHWYVATQYTGLYKPEQILQEPWLDHLLQMSPMVKSFDLTPQEQIRIYQDSWLQQHTNRPSTDIALPDLGV